MKKITLLMMLFTAFVMAQNPQSYDEVTATGQNNGITSNGTVIVDAQMRGGTMTFTDRTTFQTEYGTACGGTLVLEDFAGSPGGVTTCGPVISSAGDGCFGAGEIQPGFDVMSSTLAGGGDLVAITAGTIGNTIDVVGANTFAEFTIFNFSVDTYAVGMDIWNNADPTTEVRTFDTGGTLVDTFTLSNTVGAEDFFGFISPVALSRVEVQEAADGGDLIGNLEFGDCPALSVEDNLAQLVSIFPNPVNDVLNVKVPSSITIESVSLYDILGKQAGVQIVNGEINVSDLARGVYILNVETSAGTLTQKVVKQ